MTLAEAKEDIRETAYALLQEANRTGKPVDWTGYWHGYGGRGWLTEPHKRAVRAALAAGLPVPPEVLADYPELRAENPKAPWRMTRDEYLNHDRVVGYWDRETEALADSVRAHDHKVHVKRALAAGRTVPPEVLADYPDLRVGNPGSTKVNWGLIAALPADGVVYPGGPEYGAFNVSHKPADRHTVEVLLADTGIGLQRRRMIPRAGKPRAWAASEVIGGTINSQVRTGNPGVVKRFLGGALGKAGWVLPFDEFVEKVRAEMVRRGQHGSGPLEPQVVEGLRLLYDEVGEAYRVGGPEAVDRVLKGVRRNPDEWPVYRAKVSFQYGVKGERKAAIAEGTIWEKISGGARYVGGDTLERYVTLGERKGHRWGSRQLKLTQEQVDQVLEQVQTPNPATEPNPIDIATVLAVGVLAGAVQGVVEPYVTRHVYGVGTSPVGVVSNPRGQRGYRKPPTPSTHLYEVWKTEPGAKDRVVSYMWFSPQAASDWAPAYERDGFYLRRMDTGERVEPGEVGNPTYPAGAPIDRHTVEFLASHYTPAELARELAGQREIVELGRGEGLDEDRLGVYTKLLRELEAATVLQQGWRSGRVGNPYGEPTFRKGRRMWTGQMSGLYGSKAEAVEAARQFATEVTAPDGQPRDEVMIWTTGGGKKEMFKVEMARGKRGTHAA